MTATMILSLLGGFITFALYATKNIWLSILRPRLSPSPLEVLKGPNNGTLLLGHMGAYKTSCPQPERWIQRVFDKFGPVTVLRGSFNTRILSTTDLKVAAHIFANPNIYHKSPHLSFEFQSFIGEGVFTAEDDDHKRHRRAIDPAFSTHLIRNMSDMFISMSMDLRDELGKLFHTESAQSETKAGCIEVDMKAWLSRTTLDVVGIAGFDYTIDALTNQDDGLCSALTDVFSDCNINGRLLLFKGWIPLLRLWTFDSTSKRLRRLQQKFRKIAKEALARKLKAIEDGSAEVQSRDLLSLLVRANQAETSPNKKMSEEDVLGQVPSFLVGAHESVTAAVIWTLLSLVDHPDIQTRLRTELESANDNPSVDELESLEYLEHVVRESLRYHAIPAAYERVAVVDDVIPCETPYEDRHGNMRTEIIISKGDEVRVPIMLINRLESIWGPDAREFNPDRWKDLPKATEKIPSKWGNQATFIAGVRACPGYRFALLEMKALLFVLIKAYEFELAVPRETVWRRPLVAALPIIKGEKTCRLPMRLRAVTISTIVQTAYTLFRPFYAIRYLPLRHFYEASDPKSK